MFNKGEGGFKDRDLYVFCANASDGVLTAHPNLKGETLQKIKGKKGFPLGQEIMQTAAEGEIKEVPTGGLVPAPTSRSKSALFTRRSGIKTAESAITKNKSRGSGRPSRVVDLLERGDHAGVDLAAEPVEEIVHVRLKRRQALG
jgi:hypothetical protein